MHHLTGKRRVSLHRGLPGTASAAKMAQGGRGGHRVHGSGISGGQSAFEKLGSQSAALSSSGGSDSSGAEPADYSFPSGHTGAAFAMASVMFLGMPHSIGVPALIVASLIGFSRIYLGVHFPTDVLGGVVIGCAAGFVAWKLTGGKLR